MASFAGAVAAIRARLTAMRPVELPIAYPNEADPDFTNANGELAPWLFAEVSGAGSNIRGVGVPGDHVVVDDGLIILHVMVPTGTGSADAFAIAGDLGEIF